MLFNCVFVTRLITLLVFIDVTKGINAIDRQEEIEGYIRNTEEGLKEDKGSGCDTPKIDPFPDAYNTTIERKCDFHCHKMDIVKCYLSICKINPLLAESASNIQCSYRDILYVNDTEYTIGSSTVLNGDQEYKLIRSDHVKIQCAKINDNMNTFEEAESLKKEKIWVGYATGFRPVSVKPSPPGREKTYNVLMFLFDSTSKIRFIREMPNSYAFIKNELKATVLNGYNIVGDATPAALFPLLTGKTELELPDCRKSDYKSNTTHLDSFPFIFYKLKEDGYRTAYFEDMQIYGTFQDRYIGFRRQPTDHYLRDYFLVRNKPHFRCCGDTPTYDFMISLTDQFFKLDGKKFALNFISEITHDSNEIGCSDNSVVAFLKGMIARDLMTNTLVIIMSDHGPRYGDMRNTLQGELEERLPLMAIRLPDEMITRRPDAQRALEINADVLTTPHDIHATLLDVLDMTQHWNTYKVKGADLPRALTLLKPIPRNRSCSEAGIEHHWCACLRWQKVNESCPMYERAPQALLDKINSMTDLLRSKCVSQKIKSTDWVMKKIIFNNVPSRLMEVYRMKITVRPGSGTFVATATLKDDKIDISPRLISRTYAYKKDSECISNMYPHLKPFCYCKDLFLRKLRT